MAAALPDPARILPDELLAMRLASNPFTGRGRGVRADAGRFRSRRHGVGTDLDSVGPWQPGDDRRHIDWYATARTGQPQVRRHFMEAQRPTLIALDLRPHLVFGLQDSLLAGRLAWQQRRFRGASCVTNRTWR